MQDFVFNDLQLFSLPPDIEVGIDVPTVESNPEDLPSIPGAALVLTQIGPRFTTDGVGSFNSPCWWEFVLDRYACLNATTKS